jgi:cytochrome P450
MLSMDEPDHRRLRDIVDEAFRRRAVLEMEQRLGKANRPWKENSTKIRVQFF